MINEMSKQNYFHPINTWKSAQSRRTRPGRGDTQQITFLRISSRSIRLSPAVPDAPLLPYCDEPLPRFGPQETRRQGWRMMQSQTVSSEYKKLSIFRCRLRWSWVRYPHRWPGNWDQQSHHIPDLIWCWIREKAVIGHLWIWGSASFLFCLRELWSNSKMRQPDRIRLWGSLSSPCRS